MDYQNMTLIEFFSMIKNRTPMYIGGSSIVQLKAFLDGWLFGAGDNIADSDLIDKFQRWVEKKFNVISSQSWAKIILFYSNDEYHALDRFFELWDEFLQSQEA